MRESGIFRKTAAGETDQFSLNSTVGTTFVLVLPQKVNEHDEYPG